MGFQLAIRKILNMPADPSASPHLIHILYTFSVKISYASFRNERFLNIFSQF
jgi:hypothetical protein